MGASPFGSAGVLNQTPILDVLTRHVPEDTPMLATLGKIPGPKTLSPSWGVQGRENPKFEGWIDGQDVTSFDDQTSTRGKISSYYQTFLTTAQVTPEQQLVDTAGVNDEFATSRTDALTQLNLSLESAIGSDIDATEGSKTVKALTRSLGKAIDATNTDIPSAGRALSGSIRATSGMTEAQFLAVFKSVFEGGGRIANGTLFAGTDLQEAITKYFRYSGTSNDNVYNVTQAAEKKTVTMAVNLYDTNYGKIRIIPDMFLARTSGTDFTAGGNNATRGYFIPQGACALAYLSMPMFKEYEDQGGGRRGAAWARMMLVTYSPKKLAKFT